ncbi:MAG TPA: hypothetical protein VK163_01325 [Opitutaceae bacterium]|nr:hypothetical protein [Opitutaceae bacterium]
MKRPDPWLRLVAAARRAPEDETSLLPPGFATRVAAQGLALRREPADFFGFVAIRALGVALAVLVTSAMASYPLSKTSDNSNNDLDDPVAELVAQL